MNLILVPGNSKRNEHWLKQVESKAGLSFDKRYRHSYAHWSTDNADIDIDLEVKRLSTASSSLTPHVVFAKSAGSIIVSKASYEGSLRPIACIFVGFPLAMVTNYHLPVHQWLERTSFPITVLQHTEDPLGSFRKVKEFFHSAKLHNVKTLELEGVSHDYLEFEVIREHLEHYKTI